MAKKTAAQRASNKAAKANKRKKALAKRKDPLPTELRWKPLVEGVEGLARRLGLDSYVASETAPMVLKTLGLPQDSVWTNERMTNESTESILEMLEGLGVTTDAESFANRGIELSSYIRLVETDWLPRLPPDHTVHDRDKLRAAGTVLWERWLPDLVHDEELHDCIQSAGRELDAGRTNPLTLLLDTYAALGDDPVARLRRNPNGEEFVRVLLDALWDAFEAGDIESGAVTPADEEAALAALDLLVPAIVPDLLPELAPLREALAGDPAEDWDDDDDDPEAGMDLEKEEPGT